MKEILDRILFRPGPKGRKLKKRFIVLGVFLILFAYGKIKTMPKRIEWPTRGIAAELPTMNSKGEVHYNDDDRAFITIENASMKDFEKYVSLCEKAGFTIEADYGATDYRAFDEAGCELEIHFYEIFKKIDIYISTAKKGTAISWPLNDLCTQVPDPDAQEGNVSSCKGDYVYVYIIGKSEAEVNSYIDSCIADGYVIDSDRGDTFYSAYNNDGYYLHVSYSGLNEMSLEITTYKYRFEKGYEKDSEEELFGKVMGFVETTAEETTEEVTTTTTTESTTTTTEKPTTTTTEKPTTTTTEATTTTTKTEKKESSGGVDPDFKKAMDEYEDFFDEYVAFMKKYNGASSSKQAGMLMDYMTFLSEYAEAISALEEIDENSLSDADLAYYLEVMGRIQEKLLSAY